MSAGKRARCPVCHRIVFPDSGNVWRHRDKAGRNCPMSGHPFELVRQHESEVA